MTLKNICETIYTHFYISIIVVSFIVNFAVFLKAAMNYKQNSSFQMILQLNLAVADALSSPFNLWQAFHNIGYNGTTVCTVRCLKGVSVAGYAITLTAIALDRYLSLLLKRNDMTYGRRHALYVGGVWAVAFIMYMPLIFALHGVRAEYVRRHVTLAASVLLSLNESTCTALQSGGVQWDNPIAIVKLATLVLIDVLVIAGNSLVIAAVVCSSKLRSVTNFYVVSLAVTDLLVGVVVLPFSVSREVLEVWIFGEVWCSVWLAMDIWMCTASILNLCVISLDRYVAVSRPLKYQSIMTKKRAKAALGCIWILSFFICFPALLEWEVKKDSSPDPACAPNCELTNDTGYVLYSALGSFYIPMFVMLFLYWKIYKAVTKTVTAHKKGFRTLKGAKGGLGCSDDDHVALRIHLGRSLERPLGTPLSKARKSISLETSPERKTRYSRKTRGQKCLKKYQSAPSMEQIGEEKVETPSSPSRSLQSLDNARELTENELRVRQSHQPDQPPLKGNIINVGATTRKMRKMNKKNIKGKLKKFKQEAKAAKKLAITVGGFICCWLPFFSVYVVRAFCEACVSDAIFSVLFWLGYCNSAVNPLIYALACEDFRLEFKHMFCRCFCGRRGPVPPAPRPAPAAVTADSSL